MPSWLHVAIMAIHIAAGVLALPAGTLAAAARKGGRLHARAGTGFVATMLTLGVTAAILEPFRQPTPGSPLVGVFVCYFVLTSWVTARRRDGTTGWFEAAAALVALGFAAAIAWGAINGSTSPAGRGPVFILAGLSLLAGLGDLTAALRGRLTAAQRIRRHLWRMCFAFFIATGSFFIGQQDILPAAVRGSPLLFVLGFAPFALMAFWLIRLRFAKALARLTLRLPTQPSTALET
jgi:uncharacterized membrane protein